MVLPRQFRAAVTTSEAEPNVALGAGEMHMGL